MSICTITGLPSYGVSGLGLALDLIGVLILGCDLIRVQRHILKKAADDAKKLDDMADDYGGAQGWATDIRENSKWISSHSYSDHHAEDEVSFNLRRTKDSFSDLADCVSGLAEHLAKIVELQKQQLDGSRGENQISLKFSFLGLDLIIVGFLFQILGTFPC